MSANLAHTPVVSMPNAQILKEVTTALVLQEPLEMASTVKVQFKINTRFYNDTSVSNEWKAYSTNTHSTYA